MANVKISELTALTPPDAADIVPVTDSSANETKRTTVGEIVGIVNGDVDVADDGTATISELPVSKLQDGDARQLLQTDAAGTGVEWTDDVDVPGTLGVTGAATFDSTVNAAGLASLDGGIDVDGAFTVADTSGNVATSGTLDVTGATALDSTLGVNGQSTLASAAVSDLTEDRVVIAGASGELEGSANLTFDGSELGVTGTLDVSSNATVGGDLTVEGDLTIEGTTTTIETTTLLVEDKNIEMGVVDTPSDTSADGGGVTLKGATDKTINWINATDAWTSSEHIELASGKEFYIDGNSVLNATTLGSSVVNSSLTSVGTIATGTWEGDAIYAAYLDSTVVTTNDTETVTSAMLANGTIVDANISSNAEIAVSKLQDGAARQLLQTDAAGTGVEWTSSIFLPGTLSVGASISQFSSQATIKDDLEIQGTAPQLRFYESDNTDQNPWLRIANGSLIFELRTDSGTLQTGLATLNSTGLGLGVSPSSLVHLADAGDITVGTTTGTKIGTATSQKIGFYNATPVVQPTTGVAEAAFVENSGGTAINVDSTFGGYTIQQAVEALQTLGLLA